MSASTTSLTQIFIADKHLGLYKSGADNGNDNLGGKISAEEIDYISLHAVFPMITAEEAQDGNRDFHCLYLKNKSGLTVKGCAIFSLGTRSSQTHMRVGADAQGVGDGITTGKAQRIDNKNDTPDNVFFTEGTVRTDPQVLLLPDIPAYKVIPLWFERSNIFNANNEEDDNVVIVFDTANIVGDTGIAQAPGTDTTVITGQTEVNDKLNKLNSIISLEHILNNFFFLGNTTSGNDATAWINNLAKFPILNANNLNSVSFLKDIMRFVWGMLDVKFLPKRNQILNGVDPSAKSGYQYIVSKNVAYITIDTSGYQAYINPSAQYNKIVSYLDAANKNPNVDFIVVMTSRSPYGQLPDNDPVNPADPTIQKVSLDSEFRKYYHPLFTQYGVHLVVSSGINNYQRCHVLGYNEGTPASPTPYFSDKAPNYEIASGAKNFGATGSIYVNTTSGTKRPIHNVPDANIQTYVHKTVIPSETGVFYLKLFTTQRKTGIPPILDAFLYEYYEPVTTNSSSTSSLPVKEARDHFSIRYLA